MSDKEQKRSFPLRALVIAAILVGTVVAAGVILLPRLHSPGPRTPLNITYPRDVTLFPRDIVAPIFHWEDPSEAKRWQIAVAFPGGDPLVTACSDTPSWRPTEAQWKSIKERSLEKDVTVTIRGITGDPTAKVESEERVSIRTSKDPVGAPIFYRDVPLPFKEALEHLDAIRWRLGDVSSDDPPRTVLQGMRVCGNCHSFSEDGKTLAMDVDYGTDKGAYIITEIKGEVIFDEKDVITWSDYKRDDGQLTFGLLSQISPDGRYVISTVKDRSVFVPRQELYYSQFFFPVRGILVVYDRETRAFSALPGADDPSLVQSNPTWSPDGKWVLFTRDKAHELKNLKNKHSPVITQSEVKEFISGSEKMRYDLYRVPFNHGKGGEASPVPGASNNGKSNFFAKYSPDGKWIVFCQADGFMLLRPDSALYIMPAEGGTPRLMDCNMPFKMNSWHSWSPNGRWLVFASKANGPYTQLWLTHIDEQGRDSPPVLLELFTDPNRAANIPEFVNISADKLAKIHLQFADDFTLAVRSGDLHMGTGHFAEAATDFRKALKRQPDNTQVLSKLAGALIALNQEEEALGYLDKAANLDPNDASIKYKLGVALSKKNAFPGAIVCFKEALAKDPTLVPARISLAMVLHRSGSLSEAISLYKEMVHEGLEDPNLYNHFGEALMEREQYEEAIPCFRKSLELNPRNTRARTNLLKALRHR